ncbi:MAG: hypothetical protein JWO63_1195, partial [Frankiales bacterium]|nr:hypothetical protein [Frankiales bacterium]
MDDESRHENSLQAGGLAQAVDVLAEHLETFLSTSWSPAPDSEVLSAVGRIEI